AVGEAGLRRDRADYRARPHGGPEAGSLTLAWLNCERPGGDARPILFPTDRDRPIRSASSAPSAVPPCFPARGCLTRRARPGSSSVPRAWLTRSTGSGARSRGSKGTAARVFDLLKHAVGEADICLPPASHGTSDALRQSYTTAPVAGVTRPRVYLCQRGAHRGWPVHVVHSTSGIARAPASQGHVGQFRDGDRAWRDLCQD